MQWGLVGCGDIVKRSVMHAFDACASSKVYACFQRNRESAEIFAKDNNIPYIAEDVTDLVNRTAVQTVYIATPPGTHLAIIELAAAAGKHVLCEKPLATSHRDAMAALDSCREAGVRLCISFYRRTFPQVKIIKELLAQGRLGHVREVETVYETNYEPEEGAWRLDGSLGGGGALADLGSHRLDLLNYFFGAPVSISGSAGNVYRSLGKAVL